MPSLEKERKISLKTQGVFQLASKTIAESKKQDKPSNWKHFLNIKTLLKLILAINESNSLATTVRNKGCPKDQAIMHRTPKALEISLGSVYRNLSEPIQPSR